jgi:hypothetical protein
MSLQPESPRRISLAVSTEPTALPINLQPTSTGYQPMGTEAQPEQQDYAPDMMPHSQDETTVELHVGPSSVSPAKAPERRRPALRITEGGYALGDLRFKQERTPDLSPDKFNEMLNSPEVDELASRAVSAIADQTGEDIPDLKVPRLVTMDEIDGIVPRPPHEVDLREITEASEAAKANIDLFMGNLSNAIETMERGNQQLASELLQRARELTVRTTMTDRLKEYRGDIEINSTELKNGIDSKNEEIFNQFDETNRLFEVREDKRHVIESVLGRLEVLGVNTNRIDAKLKEINEKSAALYERHDYLNQRARDIRERGNLQPGDLGAFQLDEIVDPEGQSPEDREKIRAQFMYALQNPNSTHAAKFRELLQRGWEGHKALYYEEVETISQMTALEKAEGERTLEETKILNAQLDELFADLNKFDTKVYNPALDLYTSLVAEHDTRVALAYTRNFDMTPIPQQIAAHQHNLIETRREIAAQIDQDKTVTPKKLVRIQQGQEERNRPAQRRLGRFLGRLSFRGQA